MTFVAWRWHFRGECCERAA